jgi:hypothetical protein
MQYRLRTINNNKKLWENWRSQVRFSRDEEFDWKTKSEIFFSSKINAFAWALLLRGDALNDRDQAMNECVGIDRQTQFFSSTSFFIQNAIFFFLKRNFSSRKCCDKVTTSSSRSSCVIEIKDFNFSFVKY